MVMQRCRFKKRKKETIGFLVNVSVSELFEKNLILLNTGRKSLVGLRMAVFCSLLLTCFEGDGFDRQCGLLPRVV